MLLSTATMQMAYGTGQQDYQYACLKDCNPDRKTCVGIIVHERVKHATSSSKRFKRTVPAAAVHVAPLGRYGQLPS